MVTDAPEISIALVDPAASIIAPGNAIRLIAPEIETGEYVPAGTDNSIGAPGLSRSASEAEIVASIAP